MIEITASGSPKLVHNININSYINRKRRVREGEGRRGEGREKGRYKPLKRKLTRGIRAEEGSEKGEKRQ